MTRRPAAIALAVLALMAPLAACGTDVSDRYGTSDTGYVSGDGVASEIPPAEREDPIVIEGETFEGEAFDSRDHRGSPVVVNVWYASCAPCRVEAPLLEDLHTRYAPQGVTFVGVNTHDAAGPALAFEERFGITYPSLPDRDAEIMYAMRGNVSPNAVPSTLVLDGEGRVAARISGVVDPGTLSAMLDRVLAEDA